MHKFWHSFWRQGLLLLGLAGACVWYSHDALAMAGGGGGYSSGGGGSDNFVADILFEILYWLLRLCFECPQVGVPLLLIFIACVATSMLFTKDKGKSAYQGHIIRKGGAVLQQQRKVAGIESLRAKDPDFNEQKFLNRLQGAFLKIQSAWCAQKLDTVRPFISDGIHERFSLQLAEQKDLGFRDRMDGTRLQGAEFAQITNDELFDLVTVRIIWNARDYRVSLATSQPLNGVPPAQDFSEYWSLLRRRGVRTALKGGLLEGQCPNCGVILAVNQSARCTQCQAELRSGQYDWVLAEITQECEWRETEPKVLSGVQLLRIDDPNFNVQQLEDAASVMFWRMAMAERLGKIDPLRKSATPAFCETVAARLKPGQWGERTYYGERAVGSVETLGIVHAPEFHHALVEVRWAGRVFEAKPGGKVTRTERTGLFKDLLVLSRNKGVKTASAQGLASSHCSGCGAPQISNTDSTCSFCGQPQNDSSKTWVLIECHAGNDMTAREWRQRMAEKTPAAPRQADPIAAALAGNAWDKPVQPTGPTLPSLTTGSLDMLWDPQAAPSVRSGMAELAWAVKVALADGTLEPKEREWLNKIAINRGVDGMRLDLLIDSAKNGSLDIPKPRDRTEALRWLEWMARSALADGSIAGPERKLLQDLGDANGLPAAEINLLINRVKGDLYREAQQVIRESKLKKVA